uniref:Adrenodoxin-like n=1 Tax=Ciona intestinalis TaxID=7719 RepID=F6W8L4_CIOIN|nr:adrenodoxin-like [Ciona intestinalis]|eukprot:XP_002130690.1 adrenodoxin-like [Ciona intestinalis]
MSHRSFSVFRKIFSEFSKLPLRGVAIKQQTAYTHKSELLASLQQVKTFHTTPIVAKDKITINLIDRKGEKHTTSANIDDTILDVVLDNELNFESFGVCEGTVSCSTCHVIFEDGVYSLLEEPLMDEMDMLDLACGLTETSRLGCQVYLTKEMDNCTVTLPREITDARDV